MTKKELRAAIRRCNLALNAARRTEASEAIFAAVERLPEFADACCVGLYCSLPDEPRSEEVLSRWSASKRIVVPRVEGDVMHFCDYCAGQVGPGAFGIAEPVAGAAPCAPCEIDLIVVPGVAFTASGARMGRGRGYYDKYLCSAGFRALKVGVCYAHQIVAQLPLEPHDVTMDRICTE